MSHKGRIALLCCMQYQKWNINLKLPSVGIFSMSVCPEKFPDCKWPKDTLTHFLKLVYVKCRMCRNPMKDLQQKISAFWRQSTEIYRQQHSFGPSKGIFSTKQKPCNLYYFKQVKKKIWTCGRKIKTVLPWVKYWITEDRKSPKVHCLLECKWKGHILLCL